MAKDAKITAIENQFHQLEEQHRFTTDEADLILKKVEIELKLNELEKKKNESSQPERSDSGRLERLLKLLAAMIALAGFLWGIWTYLDTAAKEAAKEHETARIEASKPYLELQLKTYTKLTQTMSNYIIADNGDERMKQATQLAALYYGELPLVMDDRVALIVEDLSNLIDVVPESADGKISASEYNRIIDTRLSDIQDKSLELTRACRESLAESWGTEIWRSPKWVRTVPDTR